MTFGIIHHKIHTMERIFDLNSVIRIKQQETRTPPCRLFCEDFSISTFKRNVKMVASGVLLCFDPDEDNESSLENISEQESSCNRVQRRSLTLAQRIDVINQYKGVQSIKDLAEMYGCGRKQIQNILQHKLQYLELWEKSHQQVRNRNNFRRPKSPYLLAIGFILNEWIKRARCYQIDINDDILRNFGKEIADHLKCKDFRPSNRWLQRFKRKFKLFDSQMNVKQENVQPEDRKPLSIDSIIEDIRRDGGDWKVPLKIPEEPDAESEQNYPVEDSGDGETGDAVSQTENNTSWIQEDSAYQMDYEEENKFKGMIDNTESVNNEIETYKDALNYLGPLEQFALLKENIRAVGLINQLENIFTEQMERKS